MSTTATSETTALRAAEARAELPQLAARREDLVQRQQRLRGELADRQRWMFRTVVDSAPHQQHAAEVARLTTALDDDLVALERQERQLRVTVARDALARDRATLAALEAELATRRAQLPALLAPLIAFEDLPADFLPAGKTVQLTWAVEEQRRSVLERQGELRRSEHQARQEVQHG